MHLTNNVCLLPFIPIYITTFLCGNDHEYIQEIHLMGDNSKFHETRKVSVGSNK